MPTVAHVDSASVPAQRRRVLFLIPSLGGGGAERVFVTLLRHLDRSRFEPHLALVRAVGPYRRDVPSDVPIHDLKAGRTRYAIPSIIRLAWQLYPHTIISTLGHLNLVLLMVRPLLPQRTRVLVREGIIVSARLMQDQKHPTVWRWLYRHFYHRADKIICQSDIMRKDFTHNFGVPYEKCVCICNPLDIAHIEKLADTDGNPYLGEGPYIVAAGRLSWQKGFDLLLESIALVCKSLPEAKLTILGEGPLEAALKQQRDELGLKDVVRFVGFKLNPYPFYKHADLFVLSSRYEGLPNAALEALALRTTIVATDCPSGLLEVLNPASDLVMITKFDPTSLARAIIDAWKRVSNGRKMAVDASIPFHPEMELKHVVNGYERVLSE